MSERITLCPECNSSNIETVKIHNPDTHDMNSQATLLCRACKHIWEGLIKSDYMADQQREGFVW